LQPVAIRYLRDGKPCPIAPFIGDDDLLSHLRRLFANAQGDVHIQLLTPIASQQQERAALAYQAQQAVQLALFGETAQPAQMKEARSAKAA
jgi:1-acyl-sn-glycerol-3-phosphate acyltransferase